MRTGGSAGTRRSARISARNPRSADGPASARAAGRSLHGARTTAGHREAPTPGRRRGVEGPPGGSDAPSSERPADSEAGLRPTPGRRRAPNTRTEATKRLLIDRGGDPDIIGKGITEAMAVGQTRAADDGPKIAGTSRLRRGHAGPRSIDPHELAPPGLSHPDPDREGLLRRVRPDDRARETRTQPETAEFTGIFGKNLRGIFLNTCKDLWQKNAKTLNRCI